MVDASTAPPAVAAAVSGFIAVASSSAADAARRPARPLKRSRKDQAAEAAGLSGWAQEEEEGGAEPAVVAAGRAWQKLLKTSFNTFANPRLLSKDATRLMF